jgi:F420-non-reducing hydrogenase small subunit
MGNQKVRLNTDWLSCCGGCHVAIVDVHEKILNVLEAIEIQHCPVLTDVKSYPEAEVGILTGAIRTAHDRHVAEEMRRKCKAVIAFGTCAVYGGLPGAALAHSREDIMRQVYTDNPTTVTSICPDKEISELEKMVTPIDEAIDVDLYLPGCPPHPYFIFDALTALVENRGLNAKQETVCAKCRRHMKKTDVSEIREDHDGIPDNKTCFLSQGYICLGSVTLDRCLAPCPNQGITCTGCAGPTMQILTEPTRDIRTEISDRMSRLTKIEPAIIKTRMEESAKTHYAYAMATKMIGSKPTFLIRKWISDVEAG